MSTEVTAESPVRNELFEIETAGAEPIPEDARHSKPWELGGLWAGAFMNYASLLTGSLLLTFGLGMWDSLSAIAVGAVLAALVLGLVSVSGPRGGVPQIVFSRAVFGRRGAYLAGILTLFLAVGWFAVDCVIATNALLGVLEKLGTPRSTGLQAILLVAVVGVSVLVALYGHRTVVVFERYGAAVFLLFCAVLLAVLWPQIHWGFAATVHGTDHVAAWILGASVTFALVASWFSFAADYSRYLPGGTPVRTVTGWVALGSGLPMIALGMLGVLLYSINPSAPDLLTAIIRATPTAPAVAFLVFVALGMIWANYLDVYTAGLTTLAMDIRLPRWQTALLAGIIGGALAYYALFVTSFDQAYTNFLLVTYIWSPAWAAVVLLDLFLFHPGRYSPAAFFQRSGVIWPAVSAVLAGTLAAIPFVDSTLWQSPIAVRFLHGADLSGFVSFVVGGGVFWVSQRKHEPSSRCNTPPYGGRNA